MNKHKHLASTAVANFCNFFFKDLNKCDGKGHYTLQT